MSRIERSRKTLFANCFRSFGKKILRNCCQNCIEEITNILRITNLTRIASCSKSLLTNFCRNFSTKCLIETACRNLQKSARNFIAITTKKNTHQVVETSVTVNNKSPIQDYVHPDDQTQPAFEMTPGFKSFTKKPP